MRTLGLFDAFGGAGSTMLLLSFPGDVIDICGWRTTLSRKNPFSLSADHEQDWQPYPVDAQSAVSDDHTHLILDLEDHKHTSRKCLKMTDV